MEVDLRKLVASIVICQLAGFVGSIFTSSSVSTWYQTLNKPGFTPPGWFIGAVWITLFLLMGVALYLIWMRGLKVEGVGTALTVFILQLFLNILWSLLFFGLRSPFHAFLEIILLWVLIMASIITFYRIDRRAGLLLVPYILWVSFAAFLNYSIWQLNL
jgi:benzodiazapine receptor